MTDLSQPPVSPPVPPPAPPPAPMRRGLRWLLIASLGLNLLVVGVVVGHVVSGPPGGRPSVEIALGPFARALSPDDRRAILRGLMDRADTGEMRRADRAADLGRLAAALRAEPFDRDAVAALMAEQRDKVRGLETAVEEAVLDRLATMTAEERAGFADRLESEIGRGDGRDHDRDDDRGDGPRD